MPDAHILAEADRAALVERAEIIARALILLNADTFAHRLAMTEGVLFVQLTEHGHTPSDALTACSFYADAARAERGRLMATIPRQGGIQ